MQGLTTDLGQWTNFFRNSWRRWMHDSGTKPAPYCPTFGRHSKEKWGPIFRLGWGPTLAHSIDFSALHIRQPRQAHLRKTHNQKNTMCSWHFWRFVDVQVLRGPFRLHYLDPSVVSKKHSSFWSTFLSQHQPETGPLPNKNATPQAISFVVWLGETMWDPSYWWWRQLPSGRIYQAGMPMQ